MRIKDKEKAIYLRKQGKTYSEIKETLKISKSTLSGWLADFPLTEGQLLQLNKSRETRKRLGMEKTRLIKQKKREDRLLNQYKKQLKNWKRMTKRELELCGIFLYWGEGNKRINGPISLNNTDPSVIKFTLFWMNNILKIPREKIKVGLHLYSDMDVDEEIQFWSRELDLPSKHFHKPYVKTTKISNVSHSGFRHGTCGLIVGDVRKKEEIIMAIKAIAEIYGNRI
jgi:hypothetical protein